MMEKHKIKLLKREIPFIKFDFKAEFWFDIDRGCVVMGNQQKVTTVQLNEEHEATLPGGKKEYTAIPRTITMTSKGNVTQKR
jgi:hypothetical protein